jgi:dTMP kinase
VSTQQPLWVAVEGPAGAGKTYLARLLARKYGAQCALVDEICNYGPDTLEGQVVSALAAGGDLFLRTGHPVAETLALLALKARTWSALRPGPGTQLVLEDRGPATVAACQAAVLHPSGTRADLLRTARMILDTAEWSRPLPSLNLLITDDPAACEQRFTARTGHPVTTGMRAMTQQALAAYEMLAQDDPARWTVISRAGLSTDQVLAAMTAACDLAARAPEQSHA